MPGNVAFDSFGYLEVYLGTEAIELFFNDDVSLFSVRI